jgi:hypothetical protein
MCQKQAIIRAHYSARIRTLASQMNKLHAQAFSEGASQDTREQIDAIRRQIKEADFLQTYFTHNPDEFDA